MDNKARKPKPKSEVYQELANRTGLTRKQVSSVFDALGAVMQD